MSQTPTGWKLVPIEPTEAMVEAGRIARMNVAGGYDGPSGWQAMLDAAPESPTDHVVGSEDRCATYEEILRVVCGHLELPQSESGPADDVRLYDRALEAMDEYSKKADADLVENTRLRFKAEALVERLRKALEPLAKLEIPRKPQGNAGAYSIRHKDIEAARAALSVEVEG